MVSATKKDPLAGNPQQERKIMRRTVLLLTAMALALLLAGGMAWAAPGAPTVVSTVPPNGATGVDPDANIKAKFSEAMKARSINTNTFNLYQGHLTYEQLNGCPAPGCVADPVAATVRYNADNRTAILDPSNPLLSGTEYTAVVEGTGDGDMKAVKDRGGTPMARDYIFYFTTSGGPSPGPI
jgi:Big-like domain-containing protein